MTGSGAEAGRSTSQEETNPAGHGGRGRGGYAQEARRASEGDIGAQRASGKVRDSGFGDRTCREGASSECSLAWDRSDLLRGPWENSLEERQDSLSSDVCLFSPERKEGSGRVQKLGEAPVRRRRIQRGTEEEAVADTHKRHEERARAILVPSERRARCEIAALGTERAGKELRASVLSRGIGATC